MGSNKRHSNTTPVPVFLSLFLAIQRHKSQRPRGKKGDGPKHNDNTTSERVAVSFSAAIFVPREKIPTQSTADVIASPPKKTWASRRCFFTPRNHVGKITASSMTEAQKKRNKKLQRKSFISVVTSGTPVRIESKLAATLTPVHVSGARFPLAVDTLNGTGFFFHWSQDC